MPMFRNGRTMFAQTSGVVLSRLLLSYHSVVWLAESDASHSSHRKFGIHIPVVFNHRAAYYRGGCWPCWVPPRADQSSARGDLARPLSLVMAAPRRVCVCFSVGSGVFQDRCPIAVTGCGHSLCRWPVGGSMYRWCPASARPAPGQRPIGARSVPDRSKTLGLIFRFRDDLCDSKDPKSPAGLEQQETCGRSLGFGFSNACSYHSPKGQHGRPIGAAGERGD